MFEENSYELARRIKLNHRFELVVKASLKPSGLVKFNIGLFNIEYQTYVHRLRSITLTEKETQFLIEAIDGLKKELRKKSENNAIESLD